MGNILIFGGSGGLGSEMTKLFKFQGFNVRSLSSSDCDVRNIDEIPPIADYDYVISMVAINRDNLLVRSLPEDVKEQIDVNIIGNINIIRQAFASWKESNKKGKIILMSSYLSIHPVRGASVYSTTKAAIDHLVRVSALENTKYGTVNSIVAGYFNGGLTNKLPDNIKASLSEKIPVGRIGTPLELYNAIRFLMDNDYITGTNLVIDGGVSLI
jgi:NAD(P)-dependent dehydrogenase (short-subunit alcohol dehydrogenase family)